jgi:hypothetical protein
VIGEVPGNPALGIGDDLELRRRDRHVQPLGVTNREVLVAA